MPRALCEADRQAIWRRHQQGESAAVIAKALALKVRSVRRLLLGFGRAGGPTQPAYQHCGRQPCQDHHALCPQVLALRRLHPTWGAGRILAELSKSIALPALPNRSTIKRWLSDAGLAPPRCPTRPAAPRASRVHQVWQMDACERIPLTDGSRVCWLRLVDEASGAVLLTWVFACGYWNDVPKQAVRDLLRLAFARWGRPEAIRVDHGTPWVCAGGLPSDLELWLAGLDVALYQIRVRRPQDNGKVERSNGTAKRWAEPSKQENALALQQRIDEEDRIQREVFRDDQGLTRRQRYPDLVHSGRGYAGSCEAAMWDWSAALLCLAGRRVRRKVSPQGQVSLYDHKYTVSQDWAGQAVEVSFDAPTLQWRFVCGQSELSSSAAGQITQARVLGLQLAGRPGRSSRQTAARKAKRSSSEQGQAAKQTP
jgi:transposase InsO family protein